LDFGCGRGGLRECLAVIRRCGALLIYHKRVLPLKKKKRGGEVDGRIERELAGLSRHPKRMIQRENYV
jgi:hypothetical protein